jgi:hypothetical protein
MTERKIEPCPFCKSHCYHQEQGGWHYIGCVGCFYRSRSERDKERAIAAHNQRCEYVRLGRAAKEFCENPPELRDVEYDIEGRNRRVGSYAEAAMVMRTLCLDRLKEKD